MCILFLPKFLIFFFTKKLTNLKILDINIGFGINEETIRNGSTGRAYSYEDLSYILKAYVKSIAVLYHSIKLKRRGVKIQIIGGDGAYITFNILGQLCDKSIFIEQLGPVTLNRFNKQSLSASGMDKSIDFNKMHDNLNYNRKSSFKDDFDLHKSYMDEEKINDGVIQLSRNTIIIYLHDFIDSPGLHGNNLYESHVDWIKSLIFLAKKHNRKIIIKGHPNQRAKSEKILLDLSIKENFYVSYGKISVINILKSQAVVVTAYGSIGMELYPHKVPVIFCSDSPYASLPNHIRVNSIQMMDSFFSRNNESLYETLDYEVKMYKDIKNNLDVVGNLKIPFGYDLPYGDCSLEAWQKVLPHINRPDVYRDREIALRQISKIEQDRVFNNLNVLPEFQEFKYCLWKALELK